MPIFDRRNQKKKDMKRRFGMLCLFLCLCIVGWAQSFVIDGELENVEDGVLLHLSQVKDGAFNAVDMDSVRNGRFRLEGTVQGTKAEKVEVWGAQNSGMSSKALILWVTPGSHVKVKGDDKLTYTWRVESDVPQQQTLNRLIDASRELWVRYQQNDLEQDYCRSHRSEAGARERFERLVQEEKDLEVAIAANTIPLMRQLPVDEVWISELASLAVGVRYVEGFPYKKEVIELYESLPDSVKHTPTGKSIHTMLFPPKVVGVGEQMPDAELYDLQGGIHRLSDFKGKHILLDFWAGWCGPCRMSLPEMRELYAQYKDKLVIISLSIEGKSAWEAASATIEMPWLNLNDFQGNSGLFARCGVRGIPHYVMISPDGIVLGHWQGYGEGQLKEKVKGYLGE